MKDSVDILNQRITELEAQLQECRSVSTHRHGHTIRLQAENERLREAINDALDWANGREHEWGERAINSFEFLKAAIDEARK